MFGKVCKWLSARTKWIFNIVIAILVIGCIIVIAEVNLSQNTENRALAELKSTVSMQRSTFSDDVDSQFKTLELVADMLEYGRHFASKGIQPTLTSIVRTSELCTLCLADTDGNVTDYQGNDIGNCSDRAYFYEIMSGNSTQYCEYLKTTKNGGEARVIFSVPAYDKNGSMLGVLFCSKEISVLENSIFAHEDLFDSSSTIFICTKTGELIAANENADDDFSGDKSYQKSGFNVYKWNKGLETMRDDNVKTKEIDLNGKMHFAACTPLEADGWYLYCIVDKANVSETFSSNLVLIKKTIAYFFVIFAAILIYIIALGKSYVKRKSREALAAKRNYENYRNILKEVQCGVVEYDINNALLATIQPELGDLKLGVLNGSLDTYEQFKAMHPEYDFNELKKELELAKRDGRTYLFESILTSNTQKICWLQTMIIPILNENDTVGKILFAIFDVSDLHRESDAVLEMYTNIPAGVYRCSLNDPIHVEYFSDGFCKMLGYSREEIDRIIGFKREYSMLISREDRAVFDEFVRNLAARGGKETCEYHLVCADGSLLAVSDTMDAKQSSSGAMYGYSVVTDLQKYKEMQQGLERELDDVKQQLEQSRIKNANSQMQPHFLYNALSSIREIVLEDPEYASDLIYDFTTHLRACIRSMSNEDLVPFTQELENIKAYVNIEKMRFGDRLRVEYNCRETEFDIIPLSLQPLVENAIRHGVYECGVRGGTVAVSTSRGDECITVCVEDDGTGFDFEKTMAEVKSGKRDSSGLYNLIFRFETLMNAHVAVESKIGSGTKVTVTIPAGGKR